MEKNKLLREISNFAIKLFYYSSILILVIVALGLMLIQLISNTLADSQMTDPLAIAGLFYVIYRLQTHWIRVRAQMRMFRFHPGATEQILQVDIAPFDIERDFSPIPVNAISFQDSPATFDAVEHIESLASEFKFLADQYELCKKVHTHITNYDAANLLLMGESLRQQQPSSRA